MEQYLELQDVTNGELETARSSQSTRAKEVDVEDGIPFRLQKPPEVEVIQVDRVSAVWDYNLFTVQLTYDEYQWTIKVRSWQLWKLHVRLTQSIGFFFQFPIELLGKKSQYAGVEEKTYVETYLRRMLGQKKILQHDKVYEFLQLGGLRFSKTYGPSLMEGYVKIDISPMVSLGSGISQLFGIRWSTKGRMQVFLLIINILMVGLLILVEANQVGIIYLVNTLMKGDMVGAQASIGLSLLLAAMCWCVVFAIASTLSASLFRRYRWMVVKPSCIAFFEDMNCTDAVAVILLDESTKIEKSSFCVHRSRWMQNGIHVTSSAVNVEIDARNTVKYVSALDAIQKAFYQSPFRVPQRHGSFAPMRPAVGGYAPNIVKPLVDGQETFEDMLQQLETAEEQVFITGWWVSPDHYLQRPIEDHPTTRLDMVLLALAERGIKIYILVYRESPFVLPNDSLYTKKTLMGLHKNIRVIRHPFFKVVPSYWSHHEKMVIIDQKVAFIGGLDLCLGRFDTCDHPLHDNDNPKHLFPGKDYSNPRVKDFQDVDTPWVDLIDRDRVPRMPWHDVACRVSGPAAVDAARHFIQRWNITATKKMDRFRLRQKDKHIIHQLLLRDMGSIKDGPIRTPTICSEVPTTPLCVRSHWEFMESDEAACHCQILRSVTNWSASVQTESSIHAAYIDLISKAENFIYIENQFFVSGFKGDPYIENRVVDALYQRIIRAYQKKENFRVMIIMPLLPAFEGAVTAKDAQSLRAVMHWQYFSISRGGSSLMEKLAAVIPKPLDYIKFFGLRNHGILNGTRITEQIYVHSKLLIVDDRKCIIGSANLNDRSLCGYRDSEIALLIEDSEFVPVEVNGTLKTAGRFAHSLRVRLMAEHLGYNYERDRQALVDIVHPDIWNNLILARAKRNTRVFERVFQCVPSDNVMSLRGFHKQRKSSAVPTYVYENQRYLWGSGWSAENLLDTDRCPWTDAWWNGLCEFDPEEEGWEIEFLENSDKAGWNYAHDFDQLAKPGSRGLKLQSWVRYRRWKVMSTSSSVENEVSVPELTTMLERTSSVQSADLQHPPFNAHALLETIEGHLVEFPLNFLCQENLRPKILPKSLFV